MTELIVPVAACGICVGVVEGALSSDADASDGHSGCSPSAECS